MVPLEAEPLLTAPWPSSGGLPACILTAVGAGSAPHPWCGHLLPPPPRARLGAGGASAGCRCPQGEGLQKPDPEDGASGWAAWTSLSAPQSVMLLSFSRSGVSASLDPVD